MVYVDVTCYLQTEFISGIQRVVREVMRRLDKKSALQIIYLRYDQQSKKFKRTSLEKNGEKSEVLEFDALSESDVFFEIDACWNVAPKRSILYEKLKEKKVQIVTYIQDILPITHPEYFGKLGNWQFLGYIVACINYADRIVVTTEATRKSFYELLEKIDCKDINIDVIGLGGDLDEKCFARSEKIDKTAFDFVAKHDKEYVLMTGTIEPRKNHRVILKAFEQKLFENQISLVIAGRIGWNSDDIVQIMNRLRENKNFVFLEGKNNSTIRYLYEHAKIVAFPSFDEGYGLPIIEAMDYDVPVIAGDVPVLREVGGSYCLYCDVNDEQDWIKKIWSLYSDDIEYSKWKKKAEDFQTLAWDDTANQLCELIKNNSELHIQKHEEKSK